jgi:hypothetical protein
MTGTASRIAGRDGRLIEMEVGCDALRWLKARRKRMNQAAESTATTTFVVRFWREWSGAEARWRGRIEHVQSGRRADFLCLDDMLDFLQRMGVTFARPTDDYRHETSASL